MHKQAIIAYCGNHFAIYTHIKLCGTPKTNTVLNVNYTSVQLEKILIKK